MSTFDPFSPRSPGEPLRASQLRALEARLARARAEHVHGQDAPLLHHDRLSPLARVKAQDLDAERVFVAGVELGLDQLRMGAASGLGQALGESLSATGGHLAGDLGVEGDLHITGGLTVGGRILAGGEAVQPTADPWGASLRRAEQSRAITPPESTSTTTYLTAERLRVSHEGLVASLTLDLKIPSVVLLRGEAQVTHYDINDYARLGEVPPRFPAYGMLALFATYGLETFPLDIIPEQRPNVERRLGRFLPRHKDRPAYRGLSSQWADVLGWPFHYVAEGESKASGRAVLTDAFLCDEGTSTLELRSYTVNTLITDGFLEAITLPLEKTS